MIYILIVVFHVPHGGNINFQEFNTLTACNHARKTLYQEHSRVELSGLETAYCVAKGK